ncbi:MAG: hypothetical protein ICV60_20130, partial [Pyrinomonadaceae bacterium]|nr:hypothetical protein [Pyrinomonadaceae bacterium]
MKKARRLLLAFLIVSAIFLGACGGGQQTVAPPLVRAGSPDFEKYQP